jgi:EAL domain-containing protein (putative c-di-GMP-specific phosphodiesterase class I)
MTQVAALAMSPQAGSPEAIGNELRAALPDIRMHSLSLHDAQGDVLWLSEGVLGPDEHGVVLEAMGERSLDPGAAVIDRPLGDGRNALVICARSAAGDVVGAAMVVVDAKQIGGGLLAKLARSSVGDALARLAAQQCPPGATAPAAPVSPAPVPPAPVPLTLALEPLTLAPEPPAPAARPVPASTPAAVRADDITRIGPKLDTRDVALFVQQLFKLRSGGRTRRYEVLLRSRSDPARDAAPAALLQLTRGRDGTSGVDRFVLAELVKWLGGHRAVWEAEPSSFTINLALATLQDPGFPPFAGALFEEHRVTPGVVGFEIPEQACVDGEIAVRSFVERCEKLGVFLALDDFSLHSTAVPLLASPAMRLLKIDARLTHAALKERLPQAMVIAIAQVAKVLGLHCVAKRLESSTARQWLTAVGVDFAQGFALERPRTLDALL